MKQKIGHGVGQRKAGQIFDPSPLAVGVDFKKDEFTVRRQDQVDRALGQAKRLHHGDASTFDLGRQVVRAIRDVAVIVMTPVMPGRLAFL
jgi:hypothetical protein